MFKKYLYKLNLSYCFCNISFFLILMILVPITLYISSPEVEIYQILLFEKATAMIENIICAFMLTVVFGLIIRYEERKIKGK